MPLIHGQLIADSTAEQGQEQRSRRGRWKRPEPPGHLHDVRRLSGDGLARHHHPRRVCHVRGTVGAVEKMFFKDPLFVSGHLPKQVAFDGLVPNCVFVFHCFSEG